MISNRSHTLSGFDLTKADNPYELCMGQIKIIYWVSSDNQNYMGRS
jgi:hypothetical protein